MKHFLFVLLCWGCSSSLFAQTDTVFTDIRQEYTTPDPQRYADIYSALFRSRQPVRFLFKWNALAVWPITQADQQYIDFANAFRSSPDRKGLSLDLAVEAKIAPWLSVNLSGNLISGHISPDLFLFDYIPKSLTYLQGRIEPRVYYQMPALIRQGLSADNMSGNYVGLELSRSELMGHSSEPHDFPERQTTATLRFGVQRRLFRYGYFDVSFGLGWRHWEQKQFIPRAREEFFANSRLALGFALAAGKGERTSENAGWCDVTRCYREEDRMWRVDLLHVLNMENTHEWLGEIPVAYERRIAHSAWTLETEARLKYGHSQTYRNISVGDGAFTWAGLGLAIEPRWYFTQKRRVALGRSGVNLSGAFAGIQVQGLYQHAYLPERPGGNINTLQVAGLPVLGLQYRILKNGFISYKAGFGLVRYSDSGYQGWLSGTPSTDPYWLSELKVGFAF